MSNYRDIGGPDGLLARTQPFNGNSMTAREGSDGVYRVFSYSTEIARLETRDDGLVKVLNVRHYSPTTSRQQNLCAAWMPGVSETYEGRPRY